MSRARGTPEQERILNRLFGREPTTWQRLKKHLLEVLITASYFVIAVIIVPPMCFMGFGLLDYLVAVGLVEQTTTARHEYLGISWMLGICVGFVSMIGRHMHGKYP